MSNRLIQPQGEGQLQVKSIIKTCLNWLAEPREKFCELEKLHHWVTDLPLYQVLKQIGLAIKDSFQKL